MSGAGREVHRGRAWRQENRVCFLVWRGSDTTVIRLGRDDTRSRIRKHFAGPRASSMRKFAWSVGRRRHALRRQAARISPPVFTPNFRSPRGRAGYSIQTQCWCSQRRWLPSPSGVRGFETYFQFSSQKTLDVFRNSCWTELGAGAFASRLTRDRRVPCTRYHVRWCLRIFANRPFSIPLSRTRAVVLLVAKRLSLSASASVAFAVPSASCVDAQ